MKQVDSEKAFELMYELFKEHPWLNEPGIMSPDDAPYESEAVAFLLAADMSNRWQGCSQSAQRVALSLLIDFTGKLVTPGHPLSEAFWSVPVDAPAWKQALAVVSHEIEQSHPHLGSRH